LISRVPLSPRSHAEKKGRRQEEEDEEEELWAEVMTTRPAWVVDADTYNLWDIGLRESHLPVDVRLSPEAAAQVLRLREWAAAEMARRAKEAEVQRQPQPQPRQLPEAVPPLQAQPEPVGGSWPSWPKQFDVNAATLAS
jgi:hypothetical protein